MLGLAGGIACIYGAEAYGASAAPSQAAPGPTAAMTQASQQPRISTSLATVKPASKQAAVIEAMMAAKGYASFVQGSGPVKLTVFVDPNCIYCHLFWKHLTTAKDWQDHYTIRWVPVAFLKPSSPGKAAAVLAEGAAGLMADERNFNMQDEEGAITPSENASLLAKVKANTARWGRQMKILDVEAGTPTIVTGSGHVFAGLVPLRQLKHEAG